MLLWMIPLLLGEGSFGGDGGGGSRRAINARRRRRCAVSIYRRFRGVK